VMPFILRGVTLLGIDSVMAPLPVRLQAWRRLALDLDPAKLAALTELVPLTEAIPRAHALMEGKVRGRIVVAITG